MKQREEIELEDEIRNRIKKTDYYEILDIPKNSSTEDIKKAYKKLALRFHPDKNKIPDAKTVFNKISEAYTCLSNSQKKRLYDERINTRQNYMKPPFQSNKFGQYSAFGQYNSGPFGSDAYFEAMNREKRRKQRQEQEMRMRQQMKKKMDEAYEKYIANARRQRKQNQQQNQYREKMNKKFQEEQREREKQKRNKKKQAEFNKRIIIFVVFCVVIVYGLLQPIAKSFEEQPIFSMVKNEKYQHQLETTVLKLPYYVTDSFFTEETTPQQKSQINEHINKRFIFGLKKQCKKSKKSKENLEKKSSRQKSESSRLRYIKMAQDVNMMACEELFRIIEEHPQLMQSVK